jgi:hypothetical protein
MYAQHSARGKQRIMAVPFQQTVWVNFEPNRCLSSLAKLCSMQKVCFNRTSWVFHLVLPLWVEVGISPAPLSPSACCRFLPVCNPMSPWHLFMQSGLAFDHSFFKANRDDMF